MGATIGFVIVSHDKPAQLLMLPARHNGNFKKRDSVL